MRTGKMSMILKRKPEEKAGGDCPSTPCCPSLDCSRDELVAYIRSMKGGERVMEMGEPWRFKIQLLSMLICLITIYVEQVIG
jgi:hypothetical protein